jgi:prevent-host-death family protein
MFAAKISELKNQLSKFVAIAKEGGTVVVLDRKTPVAKLVPYAPHELRVKPCKSPGQLTRPSKVRIANRIDVVARLREDRDQR